MISTIIPCGSAGYGDYGAPETDFIISGSDTVISPQISDRVPDITTRESLGMWLDSLVTITTNVLEPLPFREW